MTTGEAERQITEIAPDIFAVVFKAVGLGDGNGWAYELYAGDKQLYPRLSWWSSRPEQTICSSARHALQGAKRRWGYMRKRGRKLFENDWAEEVTADEAE